MTGVTLSSSLLDAVFGSTGLGEIDLDVTTDVVTNGATNTLANADLVALVSTGANCGTNPVATGLSTASSLWSTADLAKTGAQPVAGTPATPEAIKAYQDALKARNEYGGTIYTKVYEQLEKEKAARKAIMDWNDLVEAGGAFTNAKADYDVLQITVAGNTGLVATTTGTGGSVGSYGSNQVEGFEGIEGFVNAAAVAGNVAGSATAFNNAGVLQTTNAASADITDLGDVNDYLNAWEAVLKTATDDLKTAIDLGGQNLAPLREDVRRLTAGRNHVQSELTRLTAVLQK